MNWDLFFSDLFSWLAFLAIIAIAGITVAALWEIWLFRGERKNRKK